MDEAQLMQILDPGSRNLIKSKVYRSVMYPIGSVSVNELFAGIVYVCVNTEQRLLQSLCRHSFSDPAMQRGGT